MNLAWLESFAQYLRIVLNSRSIHFHCQIPHSTNSICNLNHLNHHIYRRFRRTQNKNDHIGMADSSLEYCTVYLVTESRDIWDFSLAPPIYCTFVSAETRGKSSTDMMDTESWKLVPKFCRRPLDLIMDSFLLSYILCFFFSSMILHFVVFLSLFK